MKISLGRKGVHIIGVVCIVGAGAAMWFGGVAPRMAQAADVRAQVESVDSATLALHSQLNKLQDMVNDSAATAARAQALFSTMPQEADLPNVLTRISKAATDAGISAENIESITPAVPMPLATDDRRSSAGDVAAASAAAKLGVKIAKMDISITVVGRSQQLSDFLDNLQSLDRAFLVTGTSIVTDRTVGTQSDKQSFTVTGTMFVLQSALPDLVAQVKNLVPQK